MRIKKAILTAFKRFDDLTIDLGENPAKIIALVGPNGCGKSSVFDAFEKNMQKIRAYSQETESFYSKSLFYKKEQAENNLKYKVEMVTTAPQLTTKSFYFRTSYRYTPKFNVKELAATPKADDVRQCPPSSISIDKRLEDNYKRLLSMAYQDFSDGVLTGNQVREKLIGKMNKHILNVLNVEISNLGDVLAGNGFLYFKKENVIDFPYENLSSGEKEVVDILLDLIVNSETFTDTIFCLDEPELHINSSVQRKLMLEMESIVPDSCQLWIATHSIGFMRALREDLNGKVQVLDFSEHDYFIGKKIISPIILNRKNWQRIFKTAIDDLAGLICPKKIIYCEGKGKPGKNGIEKGFDATVLNNIFSEKYNDYLFVSSGGNTELDQRSDIAIAIISKVFSELEILVLKDRDMASGPETTESDRKRYLQNNPANHRVLKRWEIENYLFDKEILKKYCSSEGLNFSEEDYDSFITDIENQNIKDDVARIKNYCNISGSISPERFKICLSKYITEDTYVFKELESCIFKNE